MKTNANRLQLLLTLLLMSALDLQSQGCSSSYHSFNQIMESYYLGENTIEANAIDSLNFNCLGCFDVDQLYKVYGKSLLENESSEILETIKRNNCKKVSSPQLQAIIDTQHFFNKRSQSDIFCDYIMRYEQLIRNNGHSALISQSDSITYDMLMDIVRSGAEVGCLFPILLHGSDKIPEGKILEFEEKLLQLVSSGKISPGAGAILLDRIYYTRYGHQKYGSMIMDGKFFPIMNVSLIDSYRHDIGLYSLEVEIKRRGLEQVEGYRYKP